MGFFFLPFEKQAGRWRVRVVPLASWVLVINLCLGLAIYRLTYQPPLAVRHPVVVQVSDTVLYIQANTWADSHVEDAAAQGDLLELRATQPDGWCRVTRPTSHLSGYVRQEALLIPASTREAARKGLLAK